MKALSPQGLKAKNSKQSFHSGRVKAGSKAYDTQVSNNV